MVFTKELELVRNIHIADKHKVKGISGVCSDLHGDLYVCGSNSSVNVFTNSGQHLRSFHGKILGNLTGICLSGDYIYLTDNANHDIHVCTTDGKYVVSLKEHNRFDNPCGDEDGFIYVCDKGNMRVVVF